MRVIGDLSVRQTVFIEFLFITATVVSFAASHFLFATESLLYRLQVGILFLSVPIVIICSLFSSLRGETSLALTIFLSIVGVMFLPALFGAGVLLLGAPLLECDFQYLFVGGFISESDCLHSVSTAATSRKL
jgi:hypothetical protein